jgi:hypothetical protein
MMGRHGSYREAVLSNRIYVSGEIMWRRRRDDSQGRPCRDSSAT